MIYFDFVFDVCFVVVLFILFLLVICLGCCEIFICCDIYVCCYCVNFVIECSVGIEFGYVEILLFCCWLVVLLKVCG